MKKLSFWLIILCAFGCQNPIEIDKNEACFKTLKEPKSFGLNIPDTAFLDKNATDIYILEHSDSWTYSQIAVFEKIDKLLKLKTNSIKEDHKITTSERIITDIEWQFMESKMDSCNFWCIDRDVIERTSIDGEYYRMQAKKGNYRQVLDFDAIASYNYNAKKSVKDDRIKLQAATFSIFRMCGLAASHNPQIAYNKKGDKHFFDVYNRDILSIEVFLNGKQILGNQGVAHFELNKSEIGNVKLRCIQTEFDGQKVTFEHVIDEDFLKQLPLK
jgi:hypothetical protein